MHHTRQTQMFIGAMALAAATASGYALFQSHALHLLFAAAVIGLAAVTSRMKVKLPGINGNMSVNLPFLLIAVVNLSAAEALAVTLISTAVQCWPRKNAKFNAQQMAFNLCMMAFASCSASLIYHSGWLASAAWNSTPAGLALAAATLFLGQTAPVAAIISMSEQKSAASIWWNLAQLSFPYYVLSGGVCCMVETASSHVGWPLVLAVFPVTYGVHRSYRLYFANVFQAGGQEVLARAAGA